MKFLEDIAGSVIALFTMLILVAGGMFAIGSMGQYIRNKMI